MGLTERLARTAARRPHVLLVPVPGHRPVRWAAEDALDALGWPRAASPAAADVLLCCGEPGAELAHHVEVAWQGLPGPRVRTTAAVPDAVPAALRGAATALIDVQAQRRDARERPAPPLSAADQQEPRVHVEGAGDAGMAGMDHDLPDGDPKDDASGATDQGEMSMTWTWGWTSRVVWSWPIGWRIATACAWRA